MRLIYSKEQIWTLGQVCYHQNRHKSAPDDGRFCNEGEATEGSNFHNSCKYGTVNNHQWKTDESAYFFPFRHLSLFSSGPGQQWQCLGTPRSYSNVPRNFLWLGEQNIVPRHLRSQQALALVPFSHLRKGGNGCPGQRQQLRIASPAEARRGVLKDNNQDGEHLRHQTAR